MQDKKKILILTYFYLPCNLTPSQRVYGWVKYLHEHGYYPIIITRNWDHFIANTSDIYKDSGQDVKVEKRGTYEVHYVPYKAGLRDRIFNKFFNTPLAFLSKILTALEVFSVGFTNFFIPHANMYRYARKILEENPDIIKMIATAKPFDIFKFAYLLHREFHLPWIADYRDPWNSQHPDIKGVSLAEKFGFNQPLLERRWVGTASRVTTVSDTLLKSIMSFTGKPGEVIMNGYLEEDYPPVEDTAPEEVKKLNILHVGSLLNNIRLDIFIEGIKKLVDTYKDKLHITAEYIGVTYIPETAELIKNMIRGYEPYFILTDRIPRTEVLKKQHACSMFYMAGHDYKGYPSSKIYEYVGTGKPVILCPTDHDIMEDILVSTGQAIICNSAEEVAARMTPLIETYLKKGRWPVLQDNSGRMQYTRKHQAAKLAHLLDSI